MWSWYPGIGHVKHTGLVFPLQDCSPWQDNPVRLQESRRLGNSCNWIEHPFKLDAGLFLIQLWSSYSFAPGTAMAPGPLQTLSNGLHEQLWHMFPYPSGTALRSGPLQDSQVTSIEQLLLQNNTQQGKDVLLIAVLTTRGGANLWHTHFHNLPEEIFKCSTSFFV